MEDDCDIDEFQESLISAKTLNTMNSESTAYYPNSPLSGIKENMDNVNGAEYID